MNTLEVHQLSKSFGKVQAVKDVSFAIPDGAVFGLIGRNGAGKTTTIRMMINIFPPDRGEIIFRGNKVGQEFRDVVGYLPEERGLYKKMRVLDTLLFFAELKGVPASISKPKALEYLERFDLLDRKTSRLEDLSKGNQQKVQFLTAILADPEFIILDEPFSGLDPINTNLLKDIIVELKNQGKVIIFSTHLMDFAEKLCDHIAMIHQGELILSGPLLDIKRRFSRRNVSLVYAGDISFLEQQPIVEKIEQFGNTTGIRVKRHEDIQTLLRLLVERGVEVKKFDANDVSLHEIFIASAGDVRPEEMSSQTPDLV